LSRQEFLLLHEKYSTGAGPIQNTEDRGTISNALEIEGQASADAALILGEDQQGAIAQQIRTVALRQQVAQIHQRIEMAELSRLR